MTPPMRSDNATTRERLVEMDAVARSTEFGDDERGREYVVTPDGAEWYIAGVQGLLLEAITHIASMTEQARLREVDCANQATEIATLAAEVERVKEWERVTREAEREERRAMATLVCNFGGGTFAEAVELSLGFRRTAFAEVKRLKGGLAERDDEIQTLRNACWDEDTARADALREVREGVERLTRDEFGLVNVRAVLALLDVTRGAA